MSKSNDEFWAAYRDPRWQRRRLEVMKSANFACEECGTTTSTLNVHHRHYVKGRKPWEYDDDDLQCLCEECHHKVSDRIRRIKEVIGKLNEDDLAVVLGYATGLYMQSIAIPGCDPMATPDGFEMAYGLADAYRRGGRPTTSDITSGILGTDSVSHSTLTKLAKSE